MANNSKYIVRQPIKDLQGKILGYEIRYAGEDKAYDGGERGNDFAAADMIYSFLTQNAGKALKDGVNFMTFTTNLLMKQAPRRSGDPGGRQRHHSPLGAAFCGALRPERVQGGGQ